MEKRESCVNQYGHGSREQGLASAAVTSSGSSYAMFGGGEVRRRRGGGNGSRESSTNAGVGASDDSNSMESVHSVTDAKGHPIGSATSSRDTSRWKGPSPPVSSDNGKRPFSMAPEASPYGAESASDNPQALQQSRIKRGRQMQQSAQKVEQSIAQVR